MNALTTIESSANKPTVVAVAAAVFDQIRAIGDIGFDLSAQTETARQVHARLESIAIARDFVARADSTEPSHQWGQLGGADGDERPTLLVFDLGYLGGCPANIWLKGAVIDPNGEYGPAEILRIDDVTKAMGAEWVALIEDTHFSKLTEV